MTLGLSANQPTAKQPIAPNQHASAADFQNFMCADYIGLVNCRSRIVATPDSCCPATSTTTR